MPDGNKCPQCGTPLPTGTLAGLCPACLLKMGAAADTVTEAKQPSFQPPTVAELAPLFPQLEILELIGKGGMGAVYKARQKQLDRVVALKILPPGIGEDAAFAERFTREAKALAKLNHPGIVTLYEFGQVQSPLSHPMGEGGQRPGEGRLFYFLMEFVDGVTLRRLLQAGRISAREALAIVPQICDALQFAHDQGIVHRDIKPENILLDRRGRVKVADFGLAKIIANDAPVTPSLSPSDGERVAKPGEGSPVLTDAGKLMGTPQYMSPEQIVAPGEVDHRADIYALGVVFYQMLTGELPDKQIVPPSRKVQIDVRLDEVVLRALEKQPALRYQQVSEVKTMVETIVATPCGSRPEEVQNDKPESEKAEVRSQKPKQESIFSWVGSLPKLNAPFVVKRGTRRAFNWPVIGMNILCGLCLVCVLLPVMLKGMDVKGRSADIIQLLFLGLFAVVFAVQLLRGIFLPVEALCAEPGVMPGRAEREPKRGRILLVRVCNGKRFINWNGVMQMWVVVYGAMLVGLYIAFGRWVPVHDLLASLVGAVTLLTGALVMVELKKPIEQLPPGGSRREEAQPEGGKECQRPVTSSPTNQESRFSPTALLGAFLIPPFFISMGFWDFGHWGGLRALIGVIVSTLGFISIFGTTVLGWIAIAQIRRSEGRLQGVWLALFDGLLLPVLLLDIVILLGLLLANRTLNVLVLARWYPVLREHAFINMPYFLIWMFFAVATVIGIDYVLIRRIWRTVNKPGDGATGSAGRASDPARQTKSSGWPYTAGGGAQFSPEVREIYEHMNADEKRRYGKLGTTFGIWNAATFFLPMACVWFFQIPVPLNWIIASLVLLLGLAFYPLWWRKMAVRLCDTAWAKEHNRNPATLRIFPFGSTGIMLLGVVSLSVVAACWWQIYQPEGVWLPYLAGNSMHKPGNGPSIRVAEVSQHGQTVLVRIICDKIPHAGELTPVFSGPLFELPYVLPAEVTNVDCLLTTAPHTYDGKTIAGTNVLSGKPSFLLGFMLPDEQAAATAVALIKRLNLGKLHGLDSPLFILRRNLGKDANGKPIAEEICCWIELRAKSAAKKPETSNFYIGQAYFPKGDSIEITSIERTTDSMTAKGRYSLASADSAMLALYITTTNSGSTRTDPKQTMQISKGSGEFELTYPHAISGWPHLSMYGDDGTPFATLYFGNKEETAEERKLDLGHDPTAGGAETRSPDMSPDDYPLVINAEHFDILHPPEPGQLDWRFNCFIPPDHLASLLFVCWSNGVPAINPGYCTYFKVGKTGGIDLFCSISCYRLASQSEFSKLNEDERQRILANCGYPESAGVTNAVWWNVNLGAGFTAGSLIAMPPLTRDDIQFPQSVHSGHQRVIPLAGFDRPEGDGNAGRSGVELRILLEPLRLPPIRVVPNEVDRTNYVSGSGLAGTMEEALNAIKTLPVEPTDDGSQLASPATNSSQQSLRERFVNRTAQDQEKYTPQQLHDAEQLYLVANQRWGTAEAKESLQTMIREYPDINRTGCAVLYLAQMSQGDERARYLQDCIDKYNDCFYGDGVQVGAYARFLLAGDCQSRGETGKAGALFDEIKTQYAGAIDHQGNLLVPEEPFLQQQLKLANAGNYWAKFKLWQAFSQGEVPVFDLHGHRTGKHEATKDPAEAGKWLAELVKGAYLAKFEPVNGFNPKTPKEMLDQFNEHCELHSGKDSLGGASFFRTTKQGEKLIGSFLTSTPDEFKKAIEQNPNFRLISIEVVTPEMFLSHEAARQESL